MSEGGPKLYDNKPKKAHLKHVDGPPLSEQLSSSMATKASSSSSQQPLSPPPPKESFARRYKFVWPLLLAVNISVGAYLFMRTKKKDVGAVEGDVPTAPVPTKAGSVAAVTVTEKTLSPPPPVVEPVKLPIPENQQRELFKWLLEEKRKVKPVDPQEKKRLDEEKAILKQFIRAKPIPSL